jgi:hypothetical protein
MLIMQTASYWWTGQSWPHNLSLRTPLFATCMNKQAAVIETKVLLALFIHLSQLVETQLQQFAL